MRRDGMGWGIMQETQLENSTPAPVVCGCSSTPGFRDGNAETENPRERGCWGIASPKPPALGAARTIIRQVCPTLHVAKPLINEACSYRPSSPRSPPPRGIVARHWELDPLVELRLTWNLVARQHPYPHIPSLGNVVRLVPNKELPLPASSRHAEFSAQRLDTMRLDSGLDVSRPLDS